MIGIRNVFEGLAPDEGNGSMFVYRAVIEAFDKQDKHIKSSCYRALYSHLCRLGAVFKSTNVAMRLMSITISLVM